MKDSFGRDITYMRISLTDRCNLRCAYCMPHGIVTVPRSEILREDEVVRIASCALRLGIRDFKLTGGEPLLRRCCVSVASRIRRLENVNSVTLTTNGTYLRDRLDALKEAGIDGINISLDTMDPERYRMLTGGGDVSAVIDAIKASVEKGIRTKINTVVSGTVHLPESAADIAQRNVSVSDSRDILELARSLPVDVRFIEMMPIGSGRAYAPGDNPSLLKALKKRYPLMSPDPVKRGNGPAVYYKIPGFRGDVGFISALHGKFCAGCSRVRLTSMGYLKTCLAYEDGTDLRRILRDPALEESDRDAQLLNAMQDAIRKKPAAHCFDEPDRMTEKHMMASIGG